VLRLIELGDAARWRVKGYSLGMRRRLGLVAALPGDPELLILDEPANGLAPEGVRWLRDFPRRFAWADVPGFSVSPCSFGRTSTDSPGGRPGVTARCW
jgi:ABC-type sugar transport system ATPase subunit